MISVSENWKRYIFGRASYLIFANLAGSSECAVIAVILKVIPLCHSLWGCGPKKTDLFKWQWLWIWLCQVFGKLQALSTQCDVLKLSLPTYYLHKEMLVAIHCLRISLGIFALFSFFAIWSLAKVHDEALGGMLYHLCATSTFITEESISSKSNVAVSQGQERESQLV